MTSAVCGPCGSALEGAPALCPSCGDDPLVAGRYLLLEVLGRGGTGVTWKARRQPDGALVCLKELRWDRMGSLKDEELFHREAALLKTLRHPSIPAYLDDFAWPSEPGPRYALWLAQELVDGVSLEVERTVRRYRPDELLQLGEDIAAILAALAGLRPPIVHRDLKPGNLMRRRDGRIVLVDFGAARAAGIAGTSGTTVAGTFGYMAPEQLRGESSTKSDVYGLAMTLCVLFAGGAPEALLDVTNRPDLDRIAGLAPSQRALLAAMLAQDPSERPTAREVEARLRALRHGDVPDAPATRAPRMPAAPAPMSASARRVRLAVFVTVFLGIAFAAWFILAQVDAVMSAKLAQPKPVSASAPSTPNPRHSAPATVARPVAPEPADPVEPPRPPSPEELAKLHQASLAADNDACRAGGAHEACARLWSGYLGEDKAALVALGLAATLASACEHGDAEACGLRGTLSVDGAGVPESRADGRTWYVRACDAGHVETCALSGRMLVDGDAGPVDAKRGVAQLQKACDAADEVACMNIGVALARGQGIPADRARALAIFEKTCKGGQSLACKNLDGLVGNNWGLPSDAKARWETLTRLCDERIGTACARAGDAAQAGRGATRDAAAALDFRRRACNLGVDEACPKTP